MNEIKMGVGEIIDITIKGARVANTFTRTDLDKSETTVLVFRTCEHAHCNSSTVNMTDPGVTVERVAPAEWPPQPGDLWRDRHGHLWFAARHWPDYDDRKDREGINEDGWRPVLVPYELGEAGDPQRPDAAIVQQNGPFVLVRREGSGEARTPGHDADCECALCDDSCSCDHHGDHAGCIPTCECAR